MTSHPNRSASNRMRWGYNGSDLVATWPAGTDYQGDAWTFSRAGGYVRCDFGNPRQHGTLGVQICARGSTTGNTLSVSSDEQFEQVAKKWMADYRRKLAE